MKSANRRRAAIAYVSSADLLPLRDGDQLIVDASIDRIVSGATDPQTLLKCIDLGVEVWSCADLHVKVIATDKHVVVSSANASLKSVHQLEEAGLLTDHPEIRRSTLALRRWISRSTRLEADDVADLIPLFGMERTAGRRAGRRSSRIHSNG
jgi:phosphatidylserine/phosphatidylglycerophosphate/cardiolipin synthase-like enzyme